MTWCFGEPSITRNGQSRPFGRHTLIEIDLIRLEAVFVAMLCTRWLCCTRSSIFFKDAIKVGFKVLSWWFEQNMLVCFFCLLTKNVSGFAFIMKFSLNICVNIPGCVCRFESWCVEYVYIPGCVWNFMSGFQNELWRIFLLSETKLVEIWWWRFPFFSMAFVLQRCVVFPEDDDAN